jgi:hypothetical protein
MFNKESFENMKQARRLHFLKKNMRVEVDGKPGRVVGNYGHNLLVKLDNIKRSCNCHPHFKVKYFNDNGELINYSVK